VVNHTVSEGMLATPDSNPLNLDSAAHVDAGVLYVRRLILQDIFGSTALDPYGFGPSWSRFIERGIYNADFAAGQTTDIAVSEVSGGTPTANYNASLSAALPAWVVSASDGDLKVVSDANASRGKALNFLQTGASQTERIYQDVPVQPYRNYAVLLNSRTILTGGTSTASVTVKGSWRDGDHVIIGSTITSGISFATSATYNEYAYFIHDQTAPAPWVAPANAVYLRIEIEVAHGLYTAGTNLSEVRLSDATLYDLTGGVSYDAHHPLYNHVADFSASPINLAAVVGANAGAAGQLIEVKVPCYHNGYTMWNTDTALFRAAKFATYRVLQREALPFTSLVLVPGSVVTTSWTPSAASKRSVSFGPPLFLRPGFYYAFVRNDTDLRTLGVGRTTTSSQSWNTWGNDANTSAGVADFGATIDPSGWANGSSGLLGLRLGL
jgi:hypothetical protein